MRLVLGGRIPDAVRAGTAADRIELVESLLEAVAQVAQSPNGLNGRAPVPTSTLFVSR